MSKRYQEADWLRRKYWDEGLQQAEMAEACDVSKATIIRWMQRHSIETRDRADYLPEREYEDADWLRKKYHDEGLSQREVAAECGATVATIHRWMVELEVDLRTKSEATSGERNPFWGTTREFSEEHKENMSKCRMGERHHFYGKSHSEETRRKISESHRERFRDHESLPRDSVGGSYTHFLWNPQRVAALERSEYTCEHPDCAADSDSLRRCPDVHHIVPAKFFEDEEDAHTLDNLVVLCPSHHLGVEHWLWVSEEKHEKLQRDTIPDRADRQARIRDFSQ